MCAKSDFQTALSSCFFQNHAKSTNYRDHHLPHLYRRYVHTKFHCYLHTLKKKKKRRSGKKVAKKISRFGKLITYNELSRRETDGGRGKKILSLSPLRQSVLLNRAIITACASSVSISPKVS